MGVRWWEDKKGLGFRFIVRSIMQGIGRDGLKAWEVVTGGKRWEMLGGVG